jgi:hypothetical protein
MDDLEILNEVFADPSIVKVLHGADSDVLWLQRDFGVYIVNMFDTGQASRVLEMSSHRLSSLLSHYCNVNVDKKYQLAEYAPSSSFFPTSSFYPTFSAEFFFTSFFLIFKSFFSASFSLPLSEITSTYDFF